MTQEETIDVEDLVRASSKSKTSSQALRRFTSRFSDLAKRVDNSIEARGDVGSPITTSGVESREETSIAVTTSNGCPTSITVVSSRENHGLRAPTSQDDQSDNVSVMTIDSVLDSVLEVPATKSRASIGKSLSTASSKRSAVNSVKRKASSSSVQQADTADKPPSIEVAALAKQTAVKETINGKPDDFPSRSLTSVQEIPVPRSLDRLSRRDTPPPRRVQPKNKPPLHKKRKKSGSKIGFLKRMLSNASQRRSNTQELQEGLPATHYSYGSQGNNLDTIGEEDTHPVPVDPTLEKVKSVDWEAAKKRVDEAKTSAKRKQTSTPARPAAVEEAIAATKSRGLEDPPTAVAPRIRNESGAPETGMQYMNRLAKQVVGSSRDAEEKPKKLCEDDDILEGGGTSQRQKKKKTATAKSINMQIAPSPTPSPSELSDLIDRDLVSVEQQIEEGGMLTPEGVERISSQKSNNDMELTTQIETAREVIPNTIDNDIKVPMRDFRHEDIREEDLRQPTESRSSIKERSVASKSKDGAKLRGVAPTSGSSPECHNNILQGVKSHESPLHVDVDFIKAENMRRSQSEVVRSCLKTKKRESLVTETMAEENADDDKGDNDDDDNWSSSCNDDTSSHLHERRIRSRATVPRTRSTGSRASRSRSTRASSRRSRKHEWSHRTRRYATTRREAFDESSDEEDSVIVIREVKHDPIVLPREPSRISRGGGEDRSVSSRRSKRSVRSSRSRRSGRSSRSNSRSGLAYKYDQSSLRRPVRRRAITSNGIVEDKEGSIIDDLFGWMCGVNPYGVYGEDDIATDSFVRV